MYKVTECKNAEDMINTLRERRIKKTKRMIRLKALMFLCIVSTLLLIITVCAKSIKPEPPVVYKTVVIERGDTLWDLAKEYYPEKEVRSAIYEIKKINGMKSSTLYEGQIIKVRI